MTHALFSRALRKLHVITSDFDWFTVLSVFCDWLKRLIWFLFYDTRLKTTLTLSNKWKYTS